MPRRRRLSADGRRVAVNATDQETDIWVWDLGRTTLTRVTFDLGIDAYQVWTPDGRRVLFSSERTGARNLYWQAADGTGAVERLTESPNQQNAVAVAPDGRWLAYEANDSGRVEIYVRPFPDVNSGHWQVSTRGGTRPALLPTFWASPTCTASPTKSPAANSIAPRMTSSSGSGRERLAPHSATNAAGAIRVLPRSVFYLSRCRPRE
jgi:hypothetical protein